MPWEEKAAITIFYPIGFQTLLNHASETGSGLFLGRIKNPENPYFISREALLPGDLLRIGDMKKRLLPSNPEGDPGHP